MLYNREAEAAKRERRREEHKVSPGVEGVRGQEGQWNEGEVGREELERREGRRLPRGSNSGRSTR
jgi:hypothetical protein